MACGILVPWPRIKPGPLAARVGSPNHWTAREFLHCSLSFFFLMWTIFKVFTEFVTVLFLFCVLVFWPLGTRNQTHAHCIGRWSLNHWTTREIPLHLFFITEWYSIVCMYHSLSVIFVRDIENKNMHKQTAIELKAIVRFIVPVIFHFRKF